MNCFLIFLGCLTFVSEGDMVKNCHHSLKVEEHAVLPALQRAPNPGLKESPGAGLENRDNSSIRVALQWADHSAWDSLLNRYVDVLGNVDYKSFSSDRGSLDDYLDDLAGKEPPESIGKNERLAYYINLYNAATVQLILDNYPLKSIKDIISPWDKKMVKMGGRMVSLGEIEHTILRKMGEPRIHFAINCASSSCPKLMNRAFTADKMESQLQEATEGFIRDSAKNHISKTSLQLSRIFNWYKKDFTEDGSLIDYLNKFAGTTISPNAKITYLEYDWSLNDAK